MQRYLRVSLLSAIVLLLVLAILDLTVKKGAMFVAYGELFENEQKTDAYNEAHRPVTATAEHRLDIPREAIEEVALADHNGTITVKRGDGDAIQLRYTVSVIADDAGEAERMAQEIVVEGIVKQERRLAFEPRAGGQKLRSDDVAIDYVLLLPDRVKLSVASTGGAVYIDGIQGDIEADSHSGMLEIVRAEGELAVEVTHGSFYAEDLRGSLTLINRYSDSHIEHVKGDVAFDLQSGRSLISQVEGKVSGEAELSSVHLQELAGAAELSGGGSFYRLTDIRGDIRLKTVGSDTSLVLPAGEGYTFDATVRDGAIHTKLPLPIEAGPDSGYDARMSGKIRSGAWNVEIEARDGSLIVHDKS